MASLTASLTTLDSRLQRIEHLLSPPPASANELDTPQTLQSLVARLAALDKSVNTLLVGIDVNAIQRVIPPSSLTNEEEEDLSIEQKRAIIASPTTPDIRQITSNLHTVQSLLPIPNIQPLTSSTSHISTAQRLADLRRKLEEDAALGIQLRRRTVEVLEVYAQGVQEVNEWWVGVEQRGKMFERGLRAKENVED
ncbi:alpha-1,6-mannosyltransferase Och1 [Saitoella coloradoensis]